ncbi:hypothetical protein FEM48_Zijuj01G0185600 [Ziziphus jujuba var. spinosa]|uniref:Isopenicillin N synthase-like Fe(2+) 2OG dioxygenase domain-containing protein n=1 Tax=Ziziphus jujuba var. spinosa TaxID=714518 RepID=A0A978W2W5_ZIZJJ|nr:hypothetical protein FEM48_Zijuj01G0185600 [Ziziphus jujuba var. spinosa]
MKYNHSSHIIFNFIKGHGKDIEAGEDSFLEQYGEPKLATRLHFNPQSPRPCHVRLRQHSDGSAITTILQDKEVEGLQYLKDNQWFRALIVPEALLINVGDVLEVSSKGLFKSPVHKIPIIDLGLLVTPSSNRVDDEFEKLGSALSTRGCFQAINHDFKSINANRGSNFPEVFISLIMPTRILHEFSMKAPWISEIVFKAMARSLSLKENCFLNQYGEQATRQPRFNFYPNCGRPCLVLGLKPHADGSTISIVLAPIILEALLINVGNQVEVIKDNVQEPSTQGSDNLERNRISVSVFYGPETDIEIEPFERLVDNSRPRLYKKVKNYGDIYFQYYQQGKRPIDAAKLPF